MGWGEEGGPSVLQGTLKVGAEEGAAEKSKGHLILLGTIALVCVLGGGGEGLGLNWKVGCASLLSQQLRALTLHTNHITPTTRLGK